MRFGTPDVLHIGLVRLAVNVAFAAPDTRFNLRTEEFGIIS
jgi:hypothetical protein